MVAMFVILMMCAMYSCRSSSISLQQAEHVMARGFVLFTGVMCGPPWWMTPYRFNQVFTTEGRYNPCLAIDDLTRFHMDWHFD